MGISRRDIERAKQIARDSGQPITHISIKLVRNRTCPNGHADFISKCGVRMFGDYVCLECSVFFAEDGTLTYQDKTFHPSPLLDAIKSQCRVEE